MDTKNFEHNKKFPQNSIKIFVLFLFHKKIKRVLKKLFYLNYGQHSPKTATKSSAKNFLINSFPSAESCPKKKYFPFRELILKASKACVSIADGKIN